jgi:uncharacterized protein YoaH (UPF0181 family)
MSVDNQQTAVEWIEELIECGANLEQIKKCLPRAKEIFEDQVIETWHNGYNNQSPMIDEENCGKQYYNETFKSE